MDVYINDEDISISHRMPSAKSYKESCWYENRPLGVNKLSTMMKDISTAAELSKIYTNHSFRATAIILWSHADLSKRQIMAISGQRNEQSLRSYNNQPSSSQLRQCSNVLSHALGDLNASTDQSQEPRSQNQLSTTFGLPSRWLCKHSDPEYNK
ncbi:hypothetical protein AC249_AIPGENE13996 [Exaiptasia diaphana]|nr:hypothetical protein AC249_AIPGENE13996 [Exaiptasia diaphana]